MDIGGFWILLARSAQQTTNPRQRLRWLEKRLSRASLAHVEDFQVHLDTARLPIDTYAMWGAASQIMGGVCSGDSFWYFQPWLIGLGRQWYDLAAGNPDDLADVPAVRALAGRETQDWGDAQWPEWESLDDVARRVHERMTGQPDSIYDALAARGHRHRSDPAPADSAWDFDSSTEIQRRLPRLAALFPRQQHVRA